GGDAAGAAGRRARAEGRGGVIGPNLVVEGDVDPVVGGLEVLCRECSGRTLGVDAVGPVLTIGQCVQRRAVEATGEVVGGGGVVPNHGVVRGNVGRSGVD